MPALDFGATPSVLLPGAVIGILVVVVFGLSYWRARKRSLVSRRHRSGAPGDATGRWDPAARDQMGIQPWMFPGTANDHGRPPGSEDRPGGRRDRVEEAQPSASDPHAHSPSEGHVPRHSGIQTDHPGRHEAHEAGGGSDPGGDSGAGGGSYHSGSSSDSGGGGGGGGE
jgi:hypothetical protein